MGEWKLTRCRPNSRCFFHVYFANFDHRFNFFDHRFNYADFDHRFNFQIQQTSKVRYSEWEQKTLRSRQRNNYKRLWFHLPSISQTLSLLAVVTSGEFININKMAGADVKKNK